MKEETKKKYLLSQLQRRSFPSKIFYHQRNVLFSCRWMSDARNASPSQSHVSSEFSHFIQLKCYEADTYSRILTRWTRSRVEWRETLRKIYIYIKSWSERRGDRTSEKHIKMPHQGERMKINAVNGQARLVAAFVTQWKIIERKHDDLCESPNCQLLSFVSSRLRSTEFAKDLQSSLKFRVGYFSSLFRV